MRKAIFLGHNPRIDIEVDVIHDDILQEMGLVLAFDDDLSNLSGVIEEVIINIYIYISEARQRARIQVDSEGTKAAAVTHGMVSAYDSLYHPIELNFDSPYVFMIYDTEMGVVLFVGVVEDTSVSFLLLSWKTPNIR